MKTLIVATTFAFAVLACVHNAHASATYDKALSDFAATPISNAAGNDAAMQKLLAAQRAELAAPHAAPKHSHKRDLPRVKNTYGTDAVAAAEGYQMALIEERVSNLEWAAMP